MLINNAGIMPIGSFVEENDATAKRMLDINVHGVIFGSKLALERFLPRGRGHIVQIASAAGKAGFPGGATYCASKHAVVGLSEAIRAEVRGTEIDVSVVMPVVVHHRARLGPARDARLQGGRARGRRRARSSRRCRPAASTSYVPKSMEGMVRLNAMMPRAAMEWIGRLLKGDQVLAQPDHVARAAYEARMARRSRPQRPHRLRKPSREAERV